MPSRSTRKRMSKRTNTKTSISKNITKKTYEKAMKSIIKRVLDTINKEIKKIVKYSELGKKIITQLFKKLHANHVKKNTSDENLTKIHDLYVEFLKKFIIMFRYNDINNFINYSTNYINEISEKYNTVYTDNYYKSTNNIVETILLVLFKCGKINNINNPHEDDLEDLDENNVQIYNDTIEDVIRFSVYYNYIDLTKYLLKQNFDYKNVYFTTALSDYEKTNPKIVKLINKTIGNNKLA